MHVVAAWYRGTPRNSGNKFRMASPLTLPNFVALRQECARYRPSKIYATGKVDQSSSKSLNKLSATHQCPSLCEISSRSARNVRGKSYRFLHLSVCWRPRGPLLQSLPISAVMYSNARTTNVPKFAQFWQPVYTRYLLPNFVDFVESVIDRRDRQKQ